MNVHYVEIDPKEATPVFNGRKRKIICGIYLIKHLTSCKVYVGSAVDIYNRWSQHLTWLRRNLHGGRHLQKAWNKYGEQDFRFTVAKRCKREDLLKWEQRFIDSYPSDHLFNISRTAGSCLGLKRSRATKLILSQKQRIISADPAERRKRSERAKAQHRAGNFGRHTWKTPKPVKLRICVKCKKKWIPDKTPIGMLTQSSRCRDCRPKHNGGNYKHFEYKYHRVLFNGERPKRSYKGIGNA